MGDIRSFLAVVCLGKFLDGPVGVGFNEALHARKLLRWDLVLLPATVRAGVDRTGFPESAREPFDCRCPDGEPLRQFLDRGLLFLPCPDDSASKIK